MLCELAPEKYLLVGFLRTDDEREVLVGGDSLVAAEIYSDAKHQCFGNFL